MKLKLIVLNITVSLLLEVVDRHGRVGLVGQSSSLTLVHKEFVVHYLIDLYV